MQLQPPPHQQFQLALASLRQGLGQPALPLALCPALDGAGELPILRVR